MLKFNVIFSKCITLEAVIVFSLRPVSLMHENPQNNSWHASCRMQRSITRSEDAFVEYPVHLISVAVIVVVV